MRSVTLDQDGNYRLDVPPDQYWLLATTGTKPSTFTQTQLDVFESQATHTTAAEAQQTRQDLTVQLRR